jgi:hypothetical protein
MVWKKSGHCARSIPRQTRSLPPTGGERVRREGINAPELRATVAQIYGRTRKSWYLKINPVWWFMNDDEQTVDLAAGITQSGPTGGAGCIGTSFAIRCRISAPTLSAQATRTIGCADASLS